MEKVALGAVMKEARKAAKLTLGSDGLILRFDSENIQTAYMSLIGPEATPYEHCFYLIRFTLAKNQPASPPSATYLTNTGISRFHPNLYPNGHVCLLILGTWEGPGWEPSTLECVGQTIRSLILTNTPLRCEPGYSFYDVGQLAPYSKSVEFHSLDFSLVHAIEKPPTGFEAFRQPLVEYFISHMDFYMAKLEWLRSKGDGVRISETYSESTVVAEYARTAQKLKGLYKKLRGEEWVAGGDGGFDPRKRIWYAECDPDLVEKAAPTEDPDYDDFELNDDLLFVEDVILDEEAFLV
jgi:ubiquitin-protein ligase